MDLPWLGGSLLALVAMMLALGGLVSAFRLMGLRQPGFEETEEEAATRREQAATERMKIGFLILAIIIVLAVGSVFYVLGNIE